MSQCQHCEYIGSCPFLESGDCEGGAYSYTVEGGCCYQWFNDESGSAQAAEGGEA
ncbi:hypothetical protein ACQ858_19715 [Variovorax ureilyticus]|uniref:hypothetical protein n=1 Tax=Variovorax ureilyticus TaxID=1836198 RepID=UPI003D66EF61